MLIFIPTYNERKNVEMMCQQLLELDLDADILFIDDNSPDGTGAILDQLSRDCHGVSVIHRSGKLGIGSAHLDGIKYAYRHGYARLLTMDCDFSHSPSYIPKLIEESRDNDFVTTTRFVLENSLEGWGRFRKGLTSLGHFITKNLFGIGYDASGAFRLYKLSSLNPQLFDNIESKGYSFFLESLLLISHRGYKIIEIPIILPNRIRGDSKMRYIDIFKGLYFIIKTYLGIKLCNKDNKLAET